MNFLEKQNKISKNKQKTLSLENNLPTEIELNDISKKYPFFGYVDIKIGDTDPFVMFSNNDDLVARSYFWKGIDAYEPTSLKLWCSLAKKAPYILDIGSYSGIYSLAASKSNPKAKIFAFEALDRVYSRLIINKQVNQVGNLQIFNKAVSNIDGELEFNVYSGASVLVTGSSLIEKEIGRDVYEKKQISAIALDGFLDKRKVGKVALIKIDAEGAEHMVLEGLKKVIKQDSPDILIELLKDAELDKIKESISCNRYNFFNINDLTGNIEQSDDLTVSTGMHNLNTLISCKSKKEIDLLTNK